MTKFFALFLLIYASLAPQRGGAWHNAPLNTSLFGASAFLKEKGFLVSLTFASAEVVNFKFLEHKFKI